MNWYFFLRPWRYIEYRRWLKLAAVDEPSPTPPPLDIQVREFMAEQFCYPLNVRVCGNKCGCISLHTGETHWGYSTSDMSHLPTDL